MSRERCKRGIRIRNVEKIIDLLKDRRNPFWAPYHAYKRLSQGITTQVELDEKLFFSLTVDVESDFGISGSAGRFNYLVSGISNLLKLFDQIGMKATFFVMKSVSDRYQKEMRKIGSAHEVGLHGYAHECWGSPTWWLEGVRVLSSEEKRSLLAESVEAMERITSRKPKSFRSPYLVIDSDTLKTLEEFDFKVDSSAPSYLGVPPKPYHPDGLSLLEIPVSADPRPWLDLSPLPHFRFDYLNTKLLARLGVGGCVNFVRSIVSYQLECGIRPHIVMLVHQWEFAGAPEIPDRSFEYAIGENVKLLHGFLDSIQKEFKVKFVAMGELARVLA